MAAAEMRTGWHRTAATCYFLHEDMAKRASSPGSDHKPDEAFGTKPQTGKYELSDGWKAVSSHYFMPDRKLDFHFHMENDGESPSKKSLLEVEVGAAVEMDWQTIDSPSTTCFSDGKVLDKDWSLAEKTSVSCSLSDSSFKALAAKNLEVVSPTVPRWRHANRGELAALIARKSSEDMGNCDLPPPVSPAAKKTSKPLVTEDVSRGDGEKITTPSSAFRTLDQKLKSKNPTPQKTSQAKRAVPAVAPEGDRNDAALFWKDLDSELLGEALCRSQTRAREAEKRASEAVSERDQLLKLFFREASMSLTYKHWIRYLEAENSILRRQEEAVELLEDEKLEKPIKRSSKHQEQQNQDPTSRSKKRRHADHSVAVLGCTVGLAFALGVGLAGAGLVFGCTMGWILITF